MPISRHRSGTLSPLSLRFRIAMIWLSVKRDFFIQNFLLSEKILPPTPPDFRGDYRLTSSAAPCCCVRGAASAPKGLLLYVGTASTGLVALRTTRSVVLPRRASSKLLRPTIGI